MISDLNPDAVQSRADLIAFVRALAKHCQSTEVENPTTPRYLEALAAWTEDMNGFFINSGRVIQSEPSWSLFAHILLAATMYE